MACGRVPFRTYTAERCFPHEVPACPSGYKSVRIDAVRGPSTIPYCLFDTDFSKVDRYKRLCEQDTWNPNPTQRIACCTGAYDEVNPDLARRICPPNLCFNSRACDDVMRAYCKTEAGKRQPICGCLLPAEEYTKSKLIGPPECIDARCAQNPRAYKTREQQSTNCNIVNCIIDAGDIDITDSNISEDLFRQQCGNEAADKLFGGNGNEEEPSPASPIYLRIMFAITRYFRGLNQGAYWALIVFISLIVLISLVGVVWLIKDIFSK